MIDFAADSGRVRTWLVCESGDRWLHAVRRFAPSMMPAPLIAATRSTEPAQVTSLLTRQSPAVILWEVEPPSLAIACDYLANTADAAPGVLQLVAGSELTDRERISVMEFPCCATIRHPEDLPGLARLIHGYFATPNQHLD